MALVDTTDPARIWRGRVVGFDPRMVAGAARCERLIPGHEQRSDHKLRTETGLGVDSSLQVRCLRNYISLYRTCVGGDLRWPTSSSCSSSTLPAPSPAHTPGFWRTWCFPAFWWRGSPWCGIGVMRERHRRLQAVPGTPLLPQIDLNQPGQRSRLIVLPELRFRVHPAQCGWQLSRV